MTPTRRRLDSELVRRGLAPSRERAAEAIRAGGVLVSGSVADRPARLVDPGEPIEMVGEPPRYVSRAGLKLEAALDALGLDVGGRRCLDLGASTGGFTDCLLQRGADSVLAVDVGRGQLHSSLRAHPRVTAVERTDVRGLDPAVVGPVGLVTADLSFISLRTVMPALAALVGRADIVVLVKPQFEVGRSRVGSGGVVRDPNLHEEAVDAVSRAGAEHGLERLGCVASPVPGADGNREFFLHLRRRA